MVIGDDAEDDRARGFRVTDSGLVLVTPDMLGQRLHFTR
jgi:glucose-1-phosphate adenylyltransferase